MTLSSTCTDRLRALAARRPRPALLRRALAITLALLAAATAFWPDVGHRTVTTTRDLPPGVQLTAADIRVVSFPTQIPGTFATPADLVGRTLSTPARAGTPLTDVNLSSVGTDEAAVAVRVTDQALADTVKPGNRVDVISPSAEVLAENAQVRETRGQVVVLTLPRRNATRVAAMSLDQALAVTLR